MSTEPFIGEIKLFGFGFAPKGYTTCSGQLLAISTNTALFSLLGTTYGGNGTQTFGLPDLRGRLALGQGQGPGLPVHTIGEVAGTQTVTLLSVNLPAHAHTLSQAKVQVAVNGTSADQNSPDGEVLGTTSTTPIYADSPTSGAFLGGTSLSGSTDATGSGQPISVMQPYLVINYSIALQGIFPSRN